MMYYNGISLFVGSPAKMNPGFIAEMSLLKERWGGPILPLKKAYYQFNGSRFYLVYLFNLFS